MKTNKCVYLLLTWIVLPIVLGGCSFCCAKADDDLEQLAPMVTNLAGAAEVSGDEPAELQGMDFLKKATVHDPGLLIPFDRYSILVQREGRHVALLVCDRELKEAYFEDAGCTAILENNYARGDRPACVPTLSPQGICGSAGQ